MINDLSFPKGYAVNDPGPNDLAAVSSKNRFDPLPQEWSFITPPMMQLDDDSSEISELLVLMPEEVADSLCTLSPKDGGELSLIDLSVSMIFPCCHSCCSFFSWGLGVSSL